MALIYGTCIYRKPRQREVTSFRRCIKFRSPSTRRRGWPLAGSCSA